MTEHSLKVDREPFLAMWNGLKKADLRDLSDRDIQVGDIVRFEEYDRDIKYYSGATLRVKITHIQRGYILPSPCCVIDCPESGKRTGIAGAMLSFRAIKRYVGDNRYAP